MNTSLASLVNRTIVVRVKEKPIATSLETIFTSAVPTDLNLIFVPLNHRFADRMEAGQNWLAKVVNANQRGVDTILTIEIIKLHEVVTLVSFNRETLELVLCITSGSIMQNLSKKITQIKELKGRYRLDNHDYYVEIDLIICDDGYIYAVLLEKIIEGEWIAKIRQTENLTPGVARQRWRELSGIKPTWNYLHKFKKA